MNHLPRIGASVLLLGLCGTGCATTGGGPKPGASAAKTETRIVRTTAYTHSESDHIRYRGKNAIGTALKYGDVRSAAADWSIYPVGTKFKIKGEPHLYVIEDYGSALVGKNTIDLYKPTRGSMRAWGTRHVDIDVMEWGSFEKSLQILRPRARYSHIRAMVQKLEQKAG